MKITPELLSIPPYISTAWKNITSLHTERGEDGDLTLIVTLTTGIQIQVPRLAQTELEAIFTAHAQYNTPNREHLNSIKKSLKHLIHSEEAPPLSLIFPNGMDFGAPGAALQHDPTQMDIPDLPEELLRQVALFSKTLGIQDPNIAPKPEPHCNCLHCQIARALQVGVSAAQEETQGEEELVSEEDLKFREWLISDKGNHLFLVENPLNTQESYTVYLKEPIGCTCGKAHCEHIRAVLND